MERLCHFHQSHIQSCRYRAKRSNTAYNLRFITAIQNSFMYIQISRIDGRISQSKEYHIFSLFQIRFHIICRLLMICFQHCFILRHRHSHRNQLLTVQFLIYAFHNLISHTFINIISRHCNHFIFPDQPQRLDGEKLRISRSHPKSI